ncbi:MAG: hypothetical protein K9L56_15720 [Clostridiales bacterium]|nr:hypothetical protein [Clostridiales bacterium]
MHKENFGIKDGRKVLLEYLTSPLWNKRDAYDAGHRLMIPLHWAVYNEDEELITAFRNHFNEMLEAYNDENVKLGTIKELQYLSLSSRYLALGAPKAQDDFRRRLGNLIFKRFSHYWSQSEAWQWDRANFPGGVRERLKWKLSVRDVKRSYYNIVFDQELYLMGIAADLTASGWADQNDCKECREAIDFFLEIMGKRLDKSRKGWVFQEGFWHEHHSFAYAGYLVKPDGEDAKPFRIKNIQQDSSHAHRWPLWLTQLEGVDDVEDYKKRLKWQLLNVVTAVQSSQNIGVPVLRNYMSGHNGFYRWNYQTHEKESGYGPYQLSGTFGLGWWSLLGGKRISGLYQTLAESYPLNKAQLSLYEGLSTRDRHELVARDHHNGFKKIIAKMASEIADKE